jgi:predicted NAD-dependent protein-ADP-ribosyltransferase YbiA (DUF1768 family)
VSADTSDLTIVYESRQDKPIGQVNWRNSDDIYLVRGIDDPASNLYLFDFTFKHPDPFNSAEHAFQYYSVFPEDAELAEKVRKEECPYKAMKLAKTCATRPSETDRLDLMKDIIAAKVNQCRALRDVMRAVKATGLDFVHSTYPADRFFGSGLHYAAKVPQKLPGENHLGRILCDCADSLLPEDEYTTSVDYEIVNGVAIILKDGEKLPESMRRNKPSQRRRSEHGVLQGETRGSARQGHYRPQAHSRSDLRCFHCGVPGHVRKDCRLSHIVVKCSACGGEGHKAKYCSVASLCYSRVASKPCVSGPVPLFSVVPNLSSFVQSAYNTPQNPHPNLTNYNLNFPPLIPNNNPPF